MKYLDEFRDVDAAKRIVDEIQSMASRRWTLMEVCGGQTHSILRHGIDEALDEVLELVHGPGCPVCVTPAEIIDQAILLALRPQTILTSFGDMLRVPGTKRSLLDTRAAGGQIQTVYGPLDAVRIAEENRDHEVVFLAVGFETTAPATALAVEYAAQRSVENFSLLSAHVRVLPVMQQLVSSGHSKIDAFLAAGHVCSVTGFTEYHAFSAKYKIPVAVTGFEPVDLLLGIRSCIDLLEQGRNEAINCYERSVSQEGNLHAINHINTVYEVTDMAWRGMGIIPQGGLKLRDSWRLFDATKKLLSSLPLFSAPPSFPVPLTVQPESSPFQTLCRSGEVLTGKLKPIDCEHFGKNCTPEHPLGAPMVSSEGACAAYHRYSTPR